MIKLCISCKKNKSLDNFYKNANCIKDGHLNQCKKCLSEKRKKYRIINKEKILISNIKYRKANKEIIKEKDKKYSQTEEGISVHKKARAKWIKNNPEKNLKAKRKWTRNNKSKKDEYYQKNKDKQIRNAVEKRRNCPHLRLRHHISSLIRQRLKNRLSSKNKKLTFDFLPYTVNNLIEHLEKQFTKGMNWNNYGKWHIDHIRPDCSFYYRNVEDKEFQECWALKNLQPLWAIDNWKKNKY